MKKPHLPKIKLPTLPKPLQKPVRIMQVAYTLLLFHILAIFAWLVVIAPLYLQPDTTDSLNDFFASMDFNLAFLLFFIFFGTPVVSLFSAWFSQMVRKIGSKTLKGYFFLHTVWFIVHTVILISVAAFSTSYTATGGSFEVFAILYPALFYPLFAMTAIIVNVFAIRKLKTKI